MPTPCDHPLPCNNCDHTTYYDFCTNKRDVTTTTTCYLHFGPASGPPTTTCGGPVLPPGRHHQLWEGGPGGYTPPRGQEEGYTGPRTSWRPLQAPSPPG